MVKVLVKIRNGASYQTNLESSLDEAEKVGVRKQNNVERHRIGLTRRR